MSLTVFRITREQKEIETCGFHHSKENIQRHETMPKFDWSAIDQSDDFLMEILKSVFWKTFPLDFDLRFDHSIEKIVLFQSTQGRSCQLVPFRSYKGFPESPDFGY